MDSKIDNSNLNPENQEKEPVATVPSDSTSNQAKKDAPVMTQNDSGSGNEDNKTKNNNKDG